MLIAYSGPTYNNKGVFSNINDSAEGLKRELSKRFTDVSVEIVVV